MDGRRRFLVLGCGVALALSALAGCGGDDDADSAAVEARIDRERAAAAKSARQEERLRRLQSDVARLRREHGRATTVVRVAPAPAPGADSDTESRVFHAPSGNVSCQLTADSAACSVAAIGTTFVLPSGGDAYVEQGMRLARSSGAPADWGASVGVGAVTCSIPQADEPRGISCVNGSTGHGFEASRVAERQKTY